MKNNPFNQNLLWVVIKWAVIIGTVGCAVIGIILHFNKR